MTEPLTQAQKPDSIDPLLMPDMSIEEINALVDAIRTRRTTTGAVYTAVKPVADRMPPSNIKEKLEKKLDKFLKALAKADLAIAKCEEYANEVAALRLQQ